MTVIWSAVLSLILLCASYFYNNLPLFTGENLLELVCSEWTKSHIFGIHDDLQEEVKDSVLLINVSYDKQLTGVYLSQQEKMNDPDGTHAIGNTDITDREKLYSLLNALNGKNYKYIFLDIAFARVYTEFGNGHKPGSECVYARRAVCPSNFQSRKEHDHGKV